MTKIAHRFAVAVSLGLVCLTVACGGDQTESRWDQAQTAPAVEKTGDVLAGGQFNRYFPPEGNGYKRVFTQEKAGFAEAKLQKGGKDLALLSVNDTAANPGATDKYRNSRQRIGGYPAAEIGNTATAVLVGDRIQVKVLSRDAGFTAAERQAWLQKFDLTGLEGLAK